jgi:hypothetical protein
MTAPKLDDYENQTKANIYTELGRCGPGEVVSLTAAQAKAHKGLVLCKAK